VEVHLSKTSRASKRMMKDVEMIALMTTIIRKEAGLVRGQENLEGKNEMKRFSHARRIKEVARGRYWYYVQMGVKYGYPKAVQPAPLHRSKSNQGPGGIKSFRHAIMHPFTLSIRFPPCLNNPSSPFLPLFVSKSFPIPLIPNDIQVPDVSPLRTSPIPACLPHQTDHGLLLCPSLFPGYIGQIRGAVAAIVVDKGDPKTVNPDLPVHGVRDGLEVCEESHQAFELGELSRGDGVEACVIKCAVQVISISVCPRREGEVYEVSA
jgi:hypothetical protein